MAKQKYPDIITIEVPNWEKYNLRKDVKHAYWFRLQNDFVEDIDVAGISDCAFRLLITFYTLCSKNSGKMFSARTDRVLNLIRKNRKTQLFQALDELVRNGLVTPTYAYKTIQDKTKQYTPPSPSGSGKKESTSAVASEESEIFKLVWEAYPRREGRHEAKLRFEKVVKVSEHESFVRAVKNYASLIVARKTETKYIKLFTSFVGSARTGTPWKSFVELDEAQRAEIEGPKEIERLSSEDFLEIMRQRRAGASHGTNGTGPALSDSDVIKG